MYRKVYFAFIIILIFFSYTPFVAAQDTINGLVQYRKVTKFNFELTENDRWNDYIATLPTEGNYTYILYFSNDLSFFENSQQDHESIHPGLQRAFIHQNYGKPPKPELKKVFSNLKERKKLELLEFMSREFLVESDMEMLPWKLTNQQRTILDYICMSATLMKEDENIVAWFTPQIPVSTGPAEFIGLPGLVLAVEKNEETLYLATSVELSLQQAGQLINQLDGKKLGLEQFDKIVKDKIREASENQRSYRGKDKR